MISQAVDRDNPWPGLASFEEGDTQFFRGRDDEIAALMRTIGREDLSLFWGLSGLGKTSLLQAGLFPRLRAADYFPVHVRLRYDARPAAANGAEAAQPEMPSLWEQCFDAIEEAAEHWKYETPSREGIDSLWLYARRRTHRFWDRNDRLVTPVLVLDQFEELFTHDREKAIPEYVIAKFLQDLSDAVTGCPPAWLVAHTSTQGEEQPDYLYRPGVFKVLLSFREDYLAHVAGVRPLVPAIDHNYFRLESMTFDQGLAVVSAGDHLIDDSKPGEREQIRKSIVEKVAPTSTSQTSATVDPALLSLFCRELNESRRNNKRPAIDRALVESAEASQIIWGFYETCMGQVRRDTREFLETRLVLPSSRSRESIAEEAALEQGVDPHEIGFLIDKRILRREKTTRGQLRLEFTHDVLIQPALNALARREADERRQQEERERLEQEQRARDERERQHAEREQALMDAREAAERARLEQEVAIQAHRAEAAAKLTRRTRLYILALSAVVLAAIWVAAVALRLSREQFVRLAIQSAQAQLAQDPQLSVFFGMRAADEADAANPRQWSSALYALNRSVRAASHLEFSFERQVIGSSLSPDGARLALVVDRGRSVEVRGGKGFRDVVKTISADEPRTVLAAYFVHGPDRLLVLQSDGSLNHVDLAGAPRTPNAPGSPAARAPTPGAAPVIDQWAFNAKTGQIVIAQFVPATNQYLQAPDPGQPAPAGTIEEQPGEFRPTPPRVSISMTGLDGRRSDVPFEATGSPKVVLAQNGQRLAVIDPDGATRILTVEGAIVGRHKFEPNTIVSLSPDGSYVLSASSPSLESVSARPSVTIWNVGEGAARTVPLPGRDQILSTRFSPDSRFLAVVQEPGLAQVWDLQKTPEMFAAPIAARGVAFSQDSQELLTWNGTEAQVWNLSSRHRTLRLLGHQDAVLDAVIVKGQGLIVTNSEQRVRVWNRSSFDQVISTSYAQELSAVGLSPGGTTVAFGGRNKLLTLTNVSNGKVTAAMATPEDIYTIAFSADGKAVAVGTAKGHVLIHREGGTGLAEAMSDPRGDITVIAFTRGTSEVAYVVQPTLDNTRAFVVVQDLGTKARKETQVDGRVLALSASSNGRTLSVSVFRLPAYDEATYTTPSIQFHRVPTADMQAPAPATASPPSEPGAAADQTVLAVGDVSGDLSFAVTSASDRIIMPWVLDSSGEWLPQTGIAFREEVQILAVAVDGRHFAASSPRGLLNLYATAGLAADPIVLFDSGPTISALAFSADGDHLASVTSDGVVTVFPFGARTLLERSEAIVKDRVVTNTECGPLGDNCMSRWSTFGLLLRSFGMGGGGR